MKRRLFLFFLVVANFCLSQAPVGIKHKASVAQKASCIPPSTSTYLRINNVSALIHTAGNNWQVPGQNFSHYEVPRNSKIMALFTSALWLGGTDVNGQLKLAALRYRDGQDYWTGPLTKNIAETTTDNCFKYDQHFVSSEEQIREFAAWYQTGLDDLANGTNKQNTLFPNYQVPRIIKEWPAHGDITIGQDYYLAPFYDRDQDGTYNWEKGDYPWYDITRTKECSVDRKVSLYGDLNYWWVMNDKGNIHSETGADPIGMEIRAQAFAFASNNEINNMTFFNYELINRGTQTLYDTYFGFFTDGALGDPYDDYVGCDVNRGLGYYYNGDNYDAYNAGFNGYGDNPPAVGVDFFEGPFQDNDGLDNGYGTGSGQALNGIGFGDGIIDNERFGMRRFLYYSNTTNGANPSQTDPINAIDYYNYLKGFWKDGSKFVYGGSGHISDPDANPNVPCDFMFPGDTDPLGWGTNGVPQQPWTEQSSNNVPNDRRFVQSAGPFILKPGAVNNITVGIVWARSYSGDPFASVEKLRRADDKAQALFENCFRVLDGPHAPDLSIQELENKLILTLSNRIGSNNYMEQYLELDPSIVTSDPTADKFYHFQGYKIYQLENEEVSLADLDNPDKARIVAQCDLKDGIGRIINFNFDDFLDASVPTEMVDGSDEGIRHSFKIEEDQFAQGDRKLVNFKTYHYMAIAYAYNNYKTYNPIDPEALDGQQVPYISSRKASIGEVKVISATPHNPIVENGGTLVPAEYGIMPRITRIDGHGNGNLSLELTEASHNTILTTGYMAEPEYETNGGPIGIKVIDPLNVADGYFECKFRDYTKVPSEGGADTASWTIYRYTSKGGSIIDSVRSDLTINVDNEQLIPDWGISVQIKQEKYFFTSVSGTPSVKVTTPISATMAHKDSNNLWLGLIPDADGYTPFNWIRSGTNNPSSDPDGNGCDDNLLAYNPCFYDDEVGWDNDKVFAKLLGGGIAPHKLTGAGTTLKPGHFMPLAYEPKFTGWSGARSAASLSYLPSVDIVITSDKSKWTRCPVIELGRDVNLAVGGAKAGEMRKSQSVDKNGNPDGTGTGMGWFPGYAIDLETGARLHMAFGEHSFLGADGGADMVWNPSSRLFNSTGDPIMGGVQPIWVFGTNMKTINAHPTLSDFPNYNPATDETSNYLQAQLTTIETGAGAAVNNAGRSVYGNLMWIVHPMTLPGKTFMSSDVTIKMRMNKEYKDYTASGKNGGKPMYGWSMSDLATTTGNTDLIADALKDINIVPNPYYAFSEYERTRLDTRVKITNLPDQCTINIYSSNGKLVRSFKKDSPITSVDWDLNNFKGIPVAGGIYLIHVDVPGVGERVLKFFGGMRQTDLQDT